MDEKRVSKKRGRTRNKTRTGKRKRRTQQRGEGGTHELVKK